MSDIVNQSTKSVNHQLIHRSMKLQWPCSDVIFLDPAIYNAIKSTIAVHRIPSILWRKKKSWFFRINFQKLRINRGGDSPDWKTGNPFVQVCPDFKDKTGNSMYAVWHNGVKRNKSGNLPVWTAKHSHIYAVHTVSDDLNVSLCTNIFNSGPGDSASFHS